MGQPARVAADEAPPENPNARFLTHGLFPPAGIDPGWECVPMGNALAGSIMAVHSVPDAYGLPCRSVAWFDRPHSPHQLGHGDLRVLVCEYPGGHRAVLRFADDRQWRLQTANIPISKPITWLRDERLAVAS